MCLAQTSQVLLSPTSRSLRLASRYKCKEGFGESVITEPRDPDLECRDGDPVLSGSPHRAAIPPPFQFTPRPHPQPTAGPENTMPELAQRLSSFSTLNLTLSLPEKSLSALTIFPF